MQITVVNKHHGASGEYIGRGSPLGNPFTHLRNTTAKFMVKDRDAAVDAYENWLNEKIQAGDAGVIRELTRLYHIAEAGHLKLQCFCAPKRCHGDVIKAALLRARANQEN